MCPTVRARLIGEPAAGYKAHATSPIAIIKPVYIIS
jgi:hypothetical protein